MSKNASFAVAALALALAMILFAASNVLGTTSDSSRPKSGGSNATSAAPFLPVKPLEPVW